MKKLIWSRVILLIVLCNIVLPGMLAGFDVFILGKDAINAIKINFAAATFVCVPFLYIPILVGLFK